MSRAILVVCVALLIAGARFEHPRIVSRPMLATTLIGMEVRDAQGNHAGRLEELVLDLEGKACATRAVAFALLGMHAGLHPLPLDALEERGAGLQLRIDPARLQPARSFSARTLANHFENNAFLHSQAEYADRLTAGVGLRAGMRSASTPADP